MYTQPALFAVERLRSFGCHGGGKAVINDGKANIFRVCLAGVFSLEDGLKLVTERGRLDGNPHEQRRDVHNFGMN